MITKVSEPTAIKKHQLFLKRHEQPIVDNVISLMDTSNRHKTELMDTMIVEDLLKLRRKNEKLGELFHNFAKSRWLIDEIYLGLSNDAPGTGITNENALHVGDKFLHKLNPESVKISKPSSIFSNPLSSSLKYKLANIVKCGTLGNDNSSDSGYEEVQDGSKLIIAQMPPPDVMQSLWVSPNPFDRVLLGKTSCVRVKGQWRVFSLNFREIAHSFAIDTWTKWL